MKRLILFHSFTQLEVKEAPTVFGAKVKTFFLRLDDVLGFTVVFCIELDVFVGSALVLKALTRETERLQELVRQAPCCLQWSLLRESACCDGGIEVSILMGEATIAALSTFDCVACQSSAASGKD